MQTRITSVSLLALSLRSIGAVSAQSSLSLILCRRAHLLIRAWGVSVAT
jgi:hypothetical protein